MNEKEWVNWSGSLKFTPQAFHEPHDEHELCQIIKQAYTAGKKIRLAGAGHSSSPLVKTSQQLIHLGKLKGITRYDKEQGSASLKTGMTVHEANQALQQVGLALFNTGDVDIQFLAGAISTGTHGSGLTLQNLSSMLQGVRLINYKGDVHEYSQEEHPEIMKALRVSLGSLGIFTEITVKTLPLFRLKRLDICTHVEHCLQHFHTLAEKNRNVDFYWYPRSDMAKIRILNEPGKGDISLSFPHTIVDEEEGWVGEVLPRHRELKFDEMEYALPQEAGIECFSEIRKRVKAKHRKEVAWRILYRIIASDDNYLSPHYGRESVSISLHHNAGLPFEDYFNDIEPIFQQYNGRPHWGKKHSMKAAALQKRYPKWEAFQEIRRSFDPEDFFINDHLRELFYSTPDL
jgi:FAD/FMN-containing dehydrogenase